MVKLLNKKAWFCIFSLTLLSLGCAGSHAKTRADKPNISTGVTQEIIATNLANNKLRDRLEQIARTAQGRVGVTATVLETGQSVNLNGNQRFPMQSVYKLPIGMAVLAQVDQGTLKLDQKVRIEKKDIVPVSVVLDKQAEGKEFTLAELLKYMVSNSDNTSCDALLRLIGGPKVVTQYVQKLGVSNLIVANTEKELVQDKAVQYRNYATPNSTIILLRALHEGRGLSQSSRALLLQLMTETPTGRNRLKGLLPQGTVVAHKTGTSSTVDVDGVAAATNDVGLVTLPNGQQLAIAVFVSDAKADMATREAAIAKISRTLWDAWNK